MCFPDPLTIAEMQHSTILNQNSDKNSHKCYITNPVAEILKVRMDHFVLKL